MKLKTFSAPTMAEALAAVRKDFGPEAMILHTRSYRVGSWLGFGGKTMVEITASAGEPERRARPRTPDRHPERADRPARRDPETLVQAADDRDAVLGGETRTAVSARNGRPARSAADLVVQRANAVVEPKPTFSQPEPANHSPANHSPANHSPANHSPANHTPTSHTPATPAQPAQQPAPRRDDRPDPMARTPIATRLPRPIDRTTDRPSDRSVDRSADRPSDRPPVRIADATPPRDPGDFEPTDFTPRIPLDSPQPAPTPAPAPAAESTATAATPDNAAHLHAQIADLQRMMGQVLETSRRTSLAMGKVDPRAAEAIEPGPLLSCINRLIDNDAPMETVDKIAGRVRDRLDAAELRDEQVVRQAVLREIEATIDTRSDSLLAISASTTTGRSRVISLIGPTGVGKTTTVAKLAATCKLRHARRVGLITSDTYRIAAVEQLRTYAGIIGLPLKVANTPDEMAQAIADFAAMDVIIVDTAGRSQHDAKRLEELKAFIAAARPDETHLVLASTVGDTVMQRTAQKFLPLGPDRCILTKLDEAVCTGQIAGLTGRIGLPLSFVTVGQEVPDDIEPARADRLARVALDGPGVLCKGSDRHAT